MRIPLSPKKLKSFFCGFFIFLLIWFEETRFGNFLNIYGNFYKNVIFRPIKMQRRDLPNQVDVWIILVVNNAAQLGQYALAHFTLRCYCSLQGYRFEVLDLSKKPSIRGKCPQNDFMFLRHCALAHFLGTHPSAEFVLFLDGDMGIVNPNHLLEEFMGPILGGPKADMLFYERTFNGEIMAGSYFLRNSPFSRHFLLHWANYEFRMPQGGEWNFGTDNAAIHAVFLDLFCGPNCADQRQICQQFWNSSTDFSNLAPFTACARNILGARNVFHSIPGVERGNVLLLTDFKKYWARDGWLTANSWCPRDFIFHGWQERRLNRPIFAGWHSPFAFSSEFQQNSTNSSCPFPELASQNWPYKDTFMKGEEEIWGKMEEIVRQRKAETMDLLKGI